MSRKFHIGFCITSAAYGFVMTFRLFIKSCRILFESVAQGNGIDSNVIYVPFVLAIFFGFSFVVFKLGVGEIRSKRPTDRDH